MSPGNTSDAELIQGLKQMDSYRSRHEDDLYGRFSYFIREGEKKYSLSHEEAFNAYSDSVIATIENIRTGGFEGNSSVKTYLFRIFQNKCVDLLRKKTTKKAGVYRTVSLADMPLELSDSARSVIQQLVDRVDRELLKQRLDQLGENCRQMLLKWGGGESDKEIAASMDYKTPEVVKTSRLRCLEKLRQLYRGHAG